MRWNSEIPVFTNTALINQGRSKFLTKQDLGNFLWFPRNAEEEIQQTELDRSINRSSPSSAAAAAIGGGMGSQPDDDNVKDTHAGHLRWTPGMDQVLIDTLNEQLALGGRLDNGWKSSSIQLVCQQVQRKVKVSVTRDQVRNRLKTFRNHQMYIKEMKMYNSGFIWDDNLKMIIADDIVWNEHLKKYPKHGAVRGKRYKHWDEILNLLDNDQAVIAKPSLLDNEQAATKPYLLEYEQAEGSERKACSQPAVDNGVDKQAAYFRWTPEMDHVLIDTLNEQLVMGAKSDNGWKGIAIQTVVQQVHLQLKVVVTKDQVRNRLKTWKHHHTYINEMRTSNSGFVWDEKTKMITADDTVWTQHLKAHPKHAVVRGKIFEHWDEINNLFANEQADGSKKVGTDAEGSKKCIEVFRGKSSIEVEGSKRDIDADIIVTEDDDSGAGESGTNASAGIDEVADGVIGNTLPHTPQRIVSQPSSKRMKTEGNISELKEILLTIADGVNGIANALQKRDKRADVKDVVNELEKIPGITTLEIIASANKIAADVQKSEMFYALSQERREEWFKAGFS